jgi:hypothetical protein
MDHRLKFRRHALGERRRQFNDRTDDRQRVLGELVRALLHASDIARRGAVTHHERALGDLALLLNDLAADTTALRDDLLPAAADAEGGAE